MPGTAAGPRKTTGKAAAQKAAKARIAASKADKAKGAQTAAGKARAALSRTARDTSAASATGGPETAAEEASTTTRSKARRPEEDDRDEGHGVEDHEGRAEGQEELVRFLRTGGPLSEDGRASCYPGRITALGSCQIVLVFGDTRARVLGLVSAMLMVDLVGIRRARTGFVGGGNRLIAAGPSGRVVPARWRRTCATRPRQSVQQRAAEGRTAGEHEQDPGRGELLAPVERRERRGVGDPLRGQRIAPTVRQVAAYTQPAPGSQNGGIGLPFSSTRLKSG